MTPRERELQQQGGNQEFIETYGHMNDINKAEIDSIEGIQREPED